MKVYVLEDWFSKLGFFLTQSYGVDPGYYSQYNLLFHEGDDFGHTNKKIIIKSPLSGVVILDDDDGRNNYGDNVKIWDDKQLCAVQICHMEYKNLVSAGQRVVAGQDIGEMGATGNANGEHVHFNFLITDAQGNRLYNTKAQNWGFLDPQHPLDPNPPKLIPGVDAYQVKWIAPINNSQQNTMQITNELYEQLVNGATVRKETAEYLGIPNPDHASKEQIVSVIGGYKSTATTLQNKIGELNIALSKETAERINRDEQVGRLNDQLTETEKTYKEQIKGLQTTIDNLPSDIGLWKGRYDVEHERYVEAMKEKGDLNIKLAEATQKLDNCQKNGASVGPSLWDVIQDFLSKFKMSK
ncbi:MAG: M23 family metallopeptidase [Agathobacter rectalis]